MREILIRLRQRICRHSGAIGYTDHFGCIDMRCARCGAHWVETKD